MTNPEPTSVSMPMPNKDVAYLPTFSIDDDDYALGCECANPALQIERWGLDDNTGSCQ